MPRLRTIAVAAVVVLVTDVTWTGPRCASRSAGRDENPSPRSCSHKRQRRTGQRRTGQRRTRRSSQLLLVSGFALSSARAARRRRSLPRRNSSSLSLRIVVSACRNVSTWPRKSARLAGYVSRTCSRVSWWNPAAANALHVSWTDGKVSIVRAVSGNHRTSSILSSFRFPRARICPGSPVG